MDRNLPRNEHPSKVPFATSAAFNDVGLAIILPLDIYPFTTLVNHARADAASVPQLGWDTHRLPGCAVGGKEWDVCVSALHSTVPIRVPSASFGVFLRPTPQSVASLRPLQRSLRDRRSQRSTIAPRPPYPPLDIYGAYRAWLTLPPTWLGHSTPTSIRSTTFMLIVHVYELRTLDHHARNLLYSILDTYPRPHLDSVDALSWRARPFRLPRPSPASCSRHRSICAGLDP
ncbi:hypothetical protein B0H14DRAFT_3484415 [Mycena olivaceomarginata]|nr:hypothetical protein B0H14DRAFT_3484415 [Mycena olivaceomarginata]